MSDERTLTSMHSLSSIGNPRLSRRHLIRSMVAGGLLVTGAAALTGCGGTSSTDNVELKLTNHVAVSDGPRAMPTKAQQDANPTNKAYADAFDAWLKKHPNVKIKGINFNPAEQKDLVSAITARTSTSIYGSGLLGGWQLDRTRTAFLRGEAADTTELIKQYEYESKVADYAKAHLPQFVVNGQWIGLPGFCVPPNGMYYRRDIFQEEGIPEPKADWTDSWTWAEFADTAKKLTKGSRRGAGMSWWLMNGMLNANNFELLTRKPIPGQNMHWTHEYMDKLALVEEMAGLFRRMYFTDKSIQTDVKYDMEQARPAFVREEVMMFVGVMYFYLHPDADASSFNGQLAKKLNKPLEDVVGYTAIPIGTNGAYDATAQPGVNGYCYFPHLSKAQLEAAFDLSFEYVMGDIVKQSTRITYELTKDPKQALRDLTPIHGWMEFEGVPGTVQEAWGAKFVEAVQASMNVPAAPRRELYFPVEATAVDTGSADKDAANGLALSETPVKDLVQTWQNTKNQQFSGFTSSISKEEFVEAATKFYADQDTFWKEKSPTFHTKEYKPFYDEIKPSLK